MNDLISRAAVLDAIDNERKLLIEREQYGAEHVVVHHARRMIEELPAVDAAPVVRCRDCMYFRPWRHDRGDNSRCEFWNTEMGAEDYCSQAIYLNNGRNDNGKDA